MNVQNEEGWSLTGGGERRSRIGLYIGIGLFIAWNILLFILAVVAIAKANEHHEGPHKASYSYQPITRTFTVSSGHTIGANTFVSLNSDGTVRDGAGTSCYTNFGPELLIAAGATDLQIISFDPDTGITSLAPNEYVAVAYTAGNAVHVRIGQISLDRNTLSSWGFPVTVTDLEKVEAMIPLTTAPGTPKTFALAGKGHIYIGEISGTTHTATFTKGADYVPLDGAVDTKAQMTRLTPNTFALSYYLIAKSGGAHVMNVTVGNVTFDKEGKYDSMTFTPAHTYESDRAYSTVFRLADNTFALAYPSVADPEVNATTAVNDSLMVRRVIVSGNALTLGPEAELKGVKPNYYMTSVGLPQNTNSNQERGVVVFVDERNNNALTAVVVSPVNNGGSLTPLNSLKFGDIKAFTYDVAGSDVWQRNKGNVVPFIDVAHIVDQEIAVAYSDYSNNGQVSTFRFVVSPHSHQIESTVAPFVISHQNPDESLDYWWVAVASLGVHHKKGWITLQYLQVPGSNGEHFVNQTIVDVAPPPFGVTTSKAKTTNGGKEIDVIISGAVKLDKKENLTPGRYYYVNTRGQLKERMGTYPSVDYVKVDSTEFLSLRSRVGVAVAKDELLLINELSEQADF